MKVIQIQYFAALREQAGKASESYEFFAEKAEDLFHELKEKYQFSLEQEDVKVAINGEYKTMDSVLINNDSVVFIPPVAGG